ncbi:MAG TPA: DegT/DnrJ/EryC1/StrS family aminotransferase [Gemmatimonas aurantiaca]|uniref:DegT/DnrJ/EryC1/StrS family aminotransferase n=1 Tax=Gemmatimonas aurantiaca TaxID=173480 RepID=A0A3D4V3V5_9BACT|nr:DegT/DnrJ/EryC1/StrS family aminotransferase [Gemmatimonas aurantiaca]HCT55799.1 DegT/DnrJ/EryC1/StrS family aminotransferase [Gemmatimonas aurantiaca]
MSNSLVSALDTLITDAAPIPFLDLVEPHRAREEEFVAAFRRALRSAAFVGGPEVEGFEREFAAYVGTQHAIGVANGTDSLRFIFLSLGIKPGDEVITASHTFIATSEAISQAGGRPVFVDIDPITMTLDPAAVAAAIGPRTVGIVPVHLYGQTADMDPLLALAAKHHLWIVEDAAQAHGARYRGRSAGTMGVAGSFSFYPGKNLGSVGEGGAVTTNDPRVLEGVRRLREHGQREKYVHVSEGYNGRLHAIQAAVLRIKLQDLDAATAGRQRVARWYQEALGDIGELSLPQVASWAEHVWHLYVVRTPVREKLRRVLTAARIGAGLHYPVPLHRQEAYAHLGYAEGALPITERTAAELLSLPMFPTLSEDQVGRVVQVVRAFFGR